MKTVKQLENKNQFVIEDDAAIYFQSYNSLCAKWDVKAQTLTLGANWDYSATTRKHLYIFIDRYTAIVFTNGTPKNKQLQKMIDTGAIFFDRYLK